VRTRESDTAKQAAAALGRLVLEQVVLSYAIGYTAGRLVVTARISAQDELARARVKRRVQSALDLVAPGTTVIVESEPPVVQGRR
jgi:hypothetical protein